MQQPTKEAPMGMVKDAALFAKGEVRRAVEEMQRVLRSSPPEAPYAAPAASPRPLASLHPWQTTRRPSPCPSGPPLLVVASQPADEGAPPFGSGILTNSWAHIGLHPWPQLREPSTPPRTVADLYRVRWEIELDNKLDKSCHRLDQIGARTAPAVR